MKRKFLKRDMDKRLLFLIVAPLIIFLFFTIYYDLTLRNLLIEYNKKAQKLGGINTELVLEELNKTSRAKDNTLMDKAALEKKYNELGTQHENLKGIKNAIQSELISVRAELKDTKAKFNGLEAQFKLLQNSNDELTKLKESIKDLCSKLASHNITEEKC